MSAEAAARLVRWRWAIYLVAAAIYFFSYFHRVAPAVVAPDLMRAFAISAATLGTLASIYPYTFAAMALVAGTLVDTLGPRWTLTGGCLTMAAGAALFGIAPGFGLALTGRLLVGIGASVILISWLTLLSEWFEPNSFGTASGATQGVGNLGALMASTPLALVVESLGWRTTFVLIGALTAVLGAVAAATIRDRPAQLGLATTNAQHRRGGSLADVLRGIPLIAGNVRSWPPLLATSAVYAPLASFLGLWGVPYLMQIHGFERVRAANHVALIAVGLIVGSPLVGWLSDRWLGRRRLPFVAFAALHALCWVPLGVPALRPAPELLAPLCFLMGFASSGLILVWSCVREVNDPGRVGLVMGFCNMPIFLAFAIIQWVLGVMLDARWGGLARDGVRLYPPAAYDAAFALCLAVAAAAIVAAALVTETRCRNVWSAPRDSAG